METLKTWPPKSAKVEKNWRVKTLKCMILRMGSNLGGYVRLPKAHPDWGKDYSDVQGVIGLISSFKDEKGDFWFSVIGKECEKDKVGRGDILEVTRRLETIARAFADKTAKVQQTQMREEEFYYRD